jgi:hypothetical protein
MGEIFEVFAGPLGFRRGIFEGEKEDIIDNLDLDHPGFKKKLESGVDGFAINEVFIIPVTKAMVEEKKSKLTKLAKHLVNTTRKMEVEF